MHFFRKSTTSLILLIGLSLSLILISCGEESTNSTQKSTDEILEDSISSIQSAEDARLDDLKGQLSKAPMFYCATDFVVVRQEPNLSSSEVDQVKLGEGLRFAGELGGDSTGVMTNDEVSIDQFAMVLTPRGKIGWVHKSVLQKERPKGVDIASLLPISLELTPGRELSKDIWKSIYMASGECDGGGCPRYFTNSDQSFMVLEVCDAMEEYEAGIYLFLPNGEKRFYEWWKEDYGTQSCHVESATTYSIEKLSETEEALIELRVKYEFEEKYGEYLLELGTDPAPFILEEKTGSNAN